MRFQQMLQDRAVLPVEAASASRIAPADTVLEARRLVKSFGGYVAVNGIDLTIRSGDIHALIGPNGAGKTTLFDLLTKFISPSGGEILFRGENITGEPPHAVARRGLVRSFQLQAMFSNLSVMDNVRIALQRPLVSPARFWQPPGSLARLGARASEILDLVGLYDWRHHRAGDLSYGRRRTLELATSVAADPVVLLLDEPTQGVGFEEVERITALVKRLAAGRTVLMVEHNMKVVAEIADRISVLRHGEIIADGPYAEVSCHPDVIEAYLGSGRHRRGRHRQERHDPA